MLTAAQATEAGDGGGQEVRGLDGGLKARASASLKSS
jgi:hypothetical protein